MSVTIMSVNLDPDTIEQLAQRVAQLMGGGEQRNVVNVQPSGQVATTAQPGTLATQHGSADYDPWAGTNAAPQAPQAPTQAYQPPAQQQPQQAPQGGPVCLHGPMRYVPGGFSRSTNRPYPAFFGCPQPKDAPDKCKSVPA